VYKNTHYELYVESMSCLMVLYLYYCNLKHVVCSPFIASPQIGPVENNTLRLWGMQPTLDPHRIVVLFFL